MSSRASDEEDNGGSRKKLRLSNDQSAFLEESFKEHNTLNPTQRLALAKQLHLRPRQVKVWFQNRRARTKLKQTEGDCETLREEIRRLQKELSDLRALKTSQPIYMQLPSITLSMCPSCERVSPNSASANAAVLTNQTHAAGPANSSAASDKPPSGSAAVLKVLERPPYADEELLTQREQRLKRDERFPPETIAPRGQAAGPSQLYGYRADTKDVAGRRLLKWDRQRRQVTVSTLLPSWGGPATDQAGAVSAVLLGEANLGETSRYKDEHLPEMCAQTGLRHEAFVHQMGRVLQRYMEENKQLKAELEQTKKNMYNEDNPAYRRQLVSEASDAIKVAFRRAASSGAIEITIPEECTFSKLFPEIVEEEREE